MISIHKGTIVPKRHIGCDSVAVVTWPDGRVTEYMDRGENNALQQALTALLTQYAHSFDEAGEENGLTLIGGRDDTKQAEKAEKSKTTA